MTMRIYADLRCLQDENYAFRGVGYHTSALLRDARPYFSRSTEVVGLLDPDMPCLPAEYAGLVDRTDSVFTATHCNGPAVFVEFSPMTHSPMKAARLLGRSDVFSCAVVYDFIPLDVPDRYLATNAARDAYISQLGWLAAYEHYFPISKYSADRLQQLLPVANSQVSVVGVALRPAFEQAMNGDNIAFDSITTISQPYVLFVGGADPRKNVEVLLRAHASISTSQPGLQLVIVGKYPKAHVEFLRKSYEALGGDRSSLRFCQAVSDRQLAWLYKHSLCTVCSSQIEGFSLPVIEAPACGAPLLASDNDAHRELLGPSNAFFAPDDSMHLASLLQRVATQSNFRDELLVAQRAVPNRFTATAVSDRFWLPIARKLRHVADRTTRGFHQGSGVQRPRLAILSPFPPDRSGVADYTRRTVQALGKRVDVDIFSETPQPTATSEVRKFLSLSQWPFISGQYDQVLTVIGNSLSYIRAIELHQQHGGPCLIHDNRLADLYYSWKGPDHFRSMARRSTGRAVSHAECRLWLEQPGKLPAMFFDEIVPHARPLIVHSKGIQAACRKQYGVEASYLPFCCYRDFPAHDLVHDARQQARGALGIPPDRVVVISLGIVSETKAPNICIEAISHLRELGTEAHLYFVGPSGGMKRRVHAWAKAFGVEDRIHLTGDWVSEETYYRFVQAADFAIQLRTHFFGGLSGAMLDCIGSGLMTVANDDLAEALESPATVLRVRDSLRAEEIADQLLHAYRTDLHSIRLRPCREAYLHEHSFDRYAEKMLELLRLRANDSAAA